MNKKFSLTADEVATLICIAALAELDPEKTAPDVMAMVYRAKSVVTVKDGRVEIRGLSIEFRR